MPKLTFEAVRRSVVIRPVTEVYLAGVGVLLLVVRNMVSLAEGLIVFGVVTMMILLMNVYRELVQVHTLLDRMRAEKILPGGKS